MRWLRIDREKGVSDSVKQVRFIILRLWIQIAFGMIGSGRWINVRNLWYEGQNSTEGIGRLSESNVVSMF